MNFVITVVFVLVLVGGVHATSYRRLDNVAYSHDDTTCTCSQLEEDETRYYFDASATIVNEFPCVSLDDFRKRFRQKIWMFEHNRGVSHEYADLAFAKRLNDIRLLKEVWMSAQFRSTFTIDQGHAMENVISFCEDEAHDYEVKLDNEDLRIDQLIVIAGDVIDNAKTLDELFEVRTLLGELDGKRSVPSEYRSYHYNDPLEYMSFHYFNKDTDVDQE